MKKHKAEEIKTETKEKEPACECGGEGQEAAPAAVEAEKQTAKAEDYYNQLLRLQADFENYRKRMEKEKPELIKWGKAEILIKLLPLYDMLLAAHLHVNNARDGGGNGDVLKGLEMIFKEFSKVFEAEGLRRMEPVGKPYDPMASEILGVVDGTEENDGLVVEELQKGFYYGEKILRPARVKIARKKAAPEPPAAEETAEAEQSGADQEQEEK
ncbi:MAG: nucleotide exchange factor GrpE [Elusimicrobia bacterium CG_4_10_14_0_2_um_filter_56_8]|nr:MAG: nucleotide exchange factor GrpE [Elusimicrobia bacterium CG1_02_56_21]PJA14664.1 MAG: nucleotide exchange factor GrpE [Elusimicrobia bacterium CG_4_10_14_0_2_um_filter_56_8]